MVRRLILVLSFLVLLSDQAYSQQVREFSEEKEEFVQNLKNYFDNVRDDETLEAFEWFIYKLEEDTISEQRVGQIRELANMMLDRRLRAHPHFGDYFKTMRALYESGRENEFFEKWHKVSLEVLPESRDDFNNLNESLRGLFENNTLYKSRSIHWYTETGDFSFDIEDGKPFIEFASLELFGQRGERGDTIKIYETSGKLYPLTTTWEGKGGRLTWQRVGFSPDDVYAEFDNYSFDISRGELDVDTVTFYNKNMFGRSLQGKLTDQASGSFSGDRSSYPEFVSYETDLEIEGMADVMHYRGGFTQKGARIMGSGTPENRARITFDFEGTETVISESQNFLISDDHIRSQNTRTKILLGEDSIYHPRHNFHYNQGTNTLRLSRRDEGVSQSPFINSFHEMEMDFDGITWEVGSPQMEVSVITDPDATVNFQSLHFYRDQDYVDLQGIMGYNPVALLRQLVRKHNDRRNFTTDDLAREMDVAEEHTLSLLNRLANRGFVYYDSELKEFYVHDKALNYYKANRGVRDHDIISFSSRAQQNRNATLSLLNYDLDIFGIERINMSDTNNVVIFPEGGEVTVKKGLDMEFDGHVMAGRFDFYGDDFYFNYNDFKTNLNNVDSVKFVFPETDPETGETHLRGIQNVIQDVNGVLYFDHPHNKSARRHKPEYPIFDCLEEAFVYYDYPHIYDGVYEREDFFFNIEPFKIDSLNDFTREGLAFEGKFHSADIFPEFENELRIQDDYSLGFETETPPDGYDMYGGAGKGDMTIKLSNEGFYGSGKIEYLGSITHSENFHLFPDSTNAESEMFEIPDDPSLDYPVTKGEDVYTQWRPYEDSLNIQLEGAFDLYAQEAQFYGDLALNPDNLSGAGQYDYRNATISSDYFAFDRLRFDADTAQLDIASDDPDVFAFKSPNVKIDFDMDEEIVDSRANDDTTTFEFPLNQYITSIRQFEWDLDAKLIDFETPDNQADKDAWFLSGNPGQDSLWFNSTEAQYNLDNYLLTPKEIPFIASADAHIFPDDKTISIEEEAKIQTMENARIELDTNNFHHEIYDALVNLFGRKDFAGYGDYDYEDMHGDIQTIHLHEIRVDRTTERVYGEGEIDKEDDEPFYLGPRFRFYGAPELASEREHLKFNGYVLPDHQQEGFRTQWFRHNEVINPDSLYFNVAEVENEDERPIFSGIFIESGARPDIYTMFMGDKRRFEDDFIFSPDSILHFDESTDNFVFDNYPSLFENKEDVGNRLEINPFQRDIDATGNFTMHQGFDHFKVTTIGDGTFRSRDSIYRFDVATIIDFPFDDELLTLMADTINDIGFRLPEVNPYNRAMRLAVNNRASGDDERNEFMEEMNVYRQIPYEGFLKASMIFTETEYVWDAENNSFNTTGQLGLGNILDERINKGMQSSGIQIGRRRGSDDFSFYIEVTGGSWYFFNIDDGGARILVSDENFEDKFNVYREEHDIDNYRLRPGSRRQVDILRRNLDLR